VNGYVGVYILDGAGNNVLDGAGDFMVTIIEISQSLIIDGAGNNVLDGNGNLLCTYN
jgi:hypothetical protein